MELLKSAVGRLRILGFLEGTSFLLLVFIAMPMKYLFDNPALVKMIGPIHGALFVLFVLYVIIVSIQKSWSLWPITIMLILASVLPFGPFYVDHKYLKKLQ